MESVTGDPFAIVSRVMEDISAALVKLVTSVQSLKVVWNAWCLDLVPMIMQGNVLNVHKDLGQYILRVTWRTCPRSCWKTTSLIYYTKNLAKWWMLGAVSSNSGSQN